MYYLFMLQYYSYLIQLLNLDLAEVMSVSQANPTPGAPKKTDDKSFFDVSYLFLFSDQMCLVVTVVFFNI